MRPIRLDPDLLVPCALAGVSLVLALRGAPMVPILHIAAIGLGLLFLLFPEWLRVETLNDPKVAWVLGFLAVTGVLVVITSGCSMSRVSDGMAWYALALLLIATVALLRRTLGGLERGGLVGGWCLLWLTVFYWPHTQVLALTSLLGLRLLWRNGWRKSALGITLGLLVLFAWALHAHPSSFSGLKLYWSETPHGSRFWLNLIRESVIRAWPIGGTEFERLRSIPPLLHREYVLALLAKTFGWPGLLAIAAAILWFFLHLFRTAQQHAGTLEGDLLQALGTLLALLSALSLAHLAWLFPWAMLLPPLSQGPILTFLFLATAALVRRLGKNPKGSTKEEEAC